MTEWQPISTAPNDDTEVLVFDPEHGVCLAEIHLLDWIATCAGNYVNVGGDMLDFIHLKPTHWMPKPNPPVHIE